MNSLRRFLWAPVVAAVVAGLGCSSSSRQTNLLSIPGGRYAEAFDATRETLRDLRFDLERVDARLGVISTRPKATSGLATPWDTEQSTLSDEVEDLVHQQRRRVRVVFLAPRPANAATPSTDDSELIPLQDAPLPRDLVSFRGTLTLRVQVPMTRTQRPGWRPSSNSVRSSTFTSDPAMEAAGLEPAYETPAGEDRELATWIVERIRERLDLPRNRASSTVPRASQPATQPPPILP